MNSSRNSAIHLNWKNGTVDGANWRERAGLALLRLAAVATQSPERPGFSRLAYGINRLFPSDKFVQLHFPDQTVYQFPYGDIYWSVLCAPNFTYEPEIEGFVRRCAEEERTYLFLDCGANFGYWSCRTTSKVAGEQNAIAIEASSECFEHAMRNRALNQNRFEAHHRALSDVNDEIVPLYGGAMHASRSMIAQKTTKMPRENVRSLRLDQLQGARPNLQRVVVKLDVEGMEIQALDGARAWLDTDALVIFEDHGRDRKHLTTKSMVEAFGMRIFHGGVDGEFQEIVDLQELDELKKVRRKGYNFFASKSPYWIEFLTSRPKR